MGIFDSDYEAQGSVSVNQVGQQRDHDDSYFGDLLLLHPTNGRNTADEIREDMKTGPSSGWRKYMRRAEREGFTIGIGSSGGGSGASFLTEVQKTYPDAASVSGSWGAQTGASQAMAIASAPGKYEYSLSLTAGGNGTIKSPTWSQIAPAMYDVLDVKISSTNKLEFVCVQGNVVTDINITANKEGYLGIVVFKDYMDNISKKLYYFSSNTVFKTSFATNKVIEGYPAIAVQDNGNNEQPYYKLGEDHAEVIRRVNVLDTMGIDFVELSKQIFDPEKIPGYQTPEWNEDYGDLYKKSPELQAEYASERIYYDDLVSSRNEAKGGIKNITDVHLGMFASPKTLDWSNAYALKAIFQDILPGVPPVDRGLLPMGTSVQASATINISSGSLKITHTFGGYKYGRVVGSVADYKPSITIPGYDDGYGTSTPDTTKPVKMKVLPDNKVSFGISEGAPAQPYGTGGLDDLKRIGIDIGTGGIYIAVSAGTDPVSGQPTYEFIEVYRPYAEHHIDVKKDGEHGTAQTVVVKGGLRGLVTKPDEYSDVLLYPLTKNAVKYTPIFKRERLMRETTMLVIDGIQVIEIKWYEKGIFKVVFFIVAVIVSCWLAACTTLTLLAAGNAGAWGAIASLALTMAATSAVAMVIMELVDDPIIAALLIVALAIAGNWGEAMSNIQMLTLAVEATGTYMQKKAVQTMEALREEFEEFRRMANEKQKELEDMMDEAGMTSNVMTNFALMRMTMPPAGEHAEDFFQRTTNRDSSIIDQTPGIEGKRTSKLPHRRNI